ncbi:hypothetical protein [Glaciimonas soli]|uniref:Uncharacterized protein n=1 Tax=Glaciimonas soli TaxID=2590999 RepID=A0A843YY50_9BURK|nr:hypothetical protein [Glaciimonas soli]MQR02181.1 hypothetical protein [Glaciimonas soli]
MAIENINSAFIEPNSVNSATTQPELLVSAVLHLMSQYTAQHQNHAETNGCTKLASVIERHLKALAALPNLAPVLRTTCQQLSEQWAAVVERTMPRAITEVQKFGLLTRLVNASR